MFHRLKLVMAGVALLALPGVAHAQSASGEIALNSTVTGACGLGAPDTTPIDLLDLTGPNGALDPAKTGASVLGTSTIADAWCNSPHTITFESSAMTLQESRPYAQPAYMARRVTFDARVSGWPFVTTLRPSNDNDTFTVEIPQAYAAPAPGLRLQVSRLQTLSLANAEAPGLMLEHGNYRGTVTITLTAAN